MSRSAVAHAFLVSLASAAVLAVTPAARADDKPAGGGAQEAPFRWDVVAVTPDDVPKGWTLLGDDAEPRPAVEKEMADAVKAAAEADKYPIEEAAIHARSLKGAENAAITLTYVDLYKDAGKVPAALKEAAAKKGWGYREVISPTRMVLVAGNEADRDAWVALVGRISAKRLGAAALESMDEEGKRTLAHAALSLEPGTASAHVALAQLAMPHEGAAAEEYKTAVDELHAALKDGVAIPLDKDAKPGATGLLGNLLLQTKGGDDVNKEARDRLKEAFDATKDSNPKRAVEYRYNLACAHARLKDKDAAFEQLTGCLEFLKDSPARGLSDWWRKDTDFDSLHDDPRWKALDEKYPDNTPPEHGE